MNNFGRFLAAVKSWEDILPWLLVEILSQLAVEGAWKHHEQLRVAKLK